MAVHKGSIDIGVKASCAASSVRTILPGGITKNNDLEGFKVKVRVMSFDEIIYGWIAIWWIKFEAIVKFVGAYMVKE